MSQELLKKVLPFTDNDLEENRRLQVSASQLQRLKAEVGKISTFCIYGLLLSIILFFVAAMIFSNLEYKKPLMQNLDSLPPLYFLFVVFVCVIFGSCFVVFLWSLIRTKNYSERLFVKMTEGKAERFSAGVDDYAFTVKVGDVDFYVDEKTHDAFTGDYYRVYFLDSSDILSVEDIKPGN